MKDMGIVQGSVGQAKSLIISADVVYVHTNIKKIVDEKYPDMELYQYHEIQYDKNEYLKIIAEKNDTLEQRLTDTQLALVEMYESIGV